MPDSQTRKTLPSIASFGASIIAGCTLAAGALAQAQSPLQRPSEQDNAGLNHKLFDAPSPRIIGGSDAPPGDWPSVVALLNTNDDRGAYWRHACGGTLIDRNWVITAAHCAADKDGNPRDAADLTVVAGETSLIAMDDSEETLLVNIFVHPDYVPATFQNDIALLELATPADTPVVSLFAGEVDALSGSDSNIIGWGATQYFSETDLQYGTELQQAVVPIVDRDSCNVPAGYNGGVLDTQFCAGFAEGQVDACAGDSGGPLIIGVNGEQVQVGIVSRGTGCALPDKYGIYTDIADYQDWILSFVGAGFVNPASDSDSPAAPPQAPDETPEEEGAGEDAPGEEAPEDDAPDGEAPAEEAPAEEAPAEEAPAEEAPAEEAPAEEAPAEEAPADPPVAEADEEGTGDDDTVDPGAGTGDDNAPDAEGDSPAGDDAAIPPPEVPVDDENAPADEATDDEVPAEGGDQADGQELPGEAGEPADEQEPDIGDDGTADDAPGADDGSVEDEVPAAPETPETPETPEAPAAPADDEAPAAPADDSTPVAPAAPAPVDEPEAADPTDAGDDGDATPPAAPAPGTDTTPAAEPDTAPPVVPDTPAEQADAPVAPVDSPADPPVATPVETPAPPAPGATPVTDVPASPVAPDADPQPGDEQPAPVAEDPASPESPAALTESDDATGGSAGDELDMTTGRSSGGGATLALLALLPLSLWRRRKRLLISGAKHMR